MFRRSSQELHHPLHLQRKGEEEECFQNAPLGIAKKQAAISDCFCIADNHGP